MGGKAIKQAGVSGRRIGAHEYHTHVAPDVYARIARAFPEAPVDVIPSVGDKPDFGDIDVLVGTGGLPRDWEQRLHGAFTPQVMINNGPVTSLDFDGFQVDIIRCPSLIYSFSLGYYSYGDLGMLLGRVARRMGFKFGHAGLFYELYHPLRETQKLATLKVTGDFVEALRFLGYDPARFAQGFKTQAAVFDFVRSGVYYDPAGFAPRNHQARARDMKRPGYRAFLADIQGDTPGPCAEASRLSHLSEALSQYPDFAAEYAKAASRSARDDALAEIFNGDRVARLTGLSGRDLYLAMRQAVVNAGGRDGLLNRLYGLPAWERDQCILSLVEGPQCDHGQGFVTG